MTNLVLTDHAVLRLAQRGIVPSDLDLIMAIGSEVEDGFLVLKKDVQVVEHALRAILKKLKKVEGKRLVIAEGHLVTAFHASDREQCKLTRRAPFSN